MSQSIIVGIFDEENTLLKGIHKLQEEGFKVLDVISPYPVHGVFKALKTKSNIPLLGFIYGLSAFFLTWYFLYWANVISYPLTFGGKPHNATPSFIIIIFVMVINLTGFLSFITLLGKTKMYPGKKVTLADVRGLDDKFVVVVEKDQKMTYDKLDLVKNLMTESGASEVNEKTV